MQKASAMIYISRTLTEIYALGKVSQGNWFDTKETLVFSTKHISSDHPKRHILYIAKWNLAFLHQVKFES